MPRIRKESAILVFQGKTPEESKQMHDSARRFQTLEQKTGSVQMSLFHQEPDEPTASVLTQFRGAGGFALFRTVFIMAHGSPEEIRFAREPITDSQLAGLLAEHAGLREDVSRYVEDSLWGREFSAFHLELHLFACETGRSRTSPDPSQGQSDTFAEGVLRQSMRRLTPVLSSPAPPAQKGREPNPIDFKLSVHAPTGWMVILKDGSPVCYTASSRDQSRVDARFKRQFESIRHPGDSYQKMAKCAVPDSRRTLSVTAEVTRHPACKEGACIASLSRLINGTTEPLGRAAPPHAPHMAESSGQKSGLDEAKSEFHRQVRESQYAQSKVLPGLVDLPVLSR